MNIGICTSLTNAAALKQAGADYIEENVQTLLVPLEPEEAFAPRLDALRAAALPVTAANCFLPGSLPCVGPGPRQGDILRYADTAFRRACAAGITRIVFGSGGSRKIPDGFPRDMARGQLVALLKALGPIAAAHGVIIVIEPLNSAECNFINSLAEGADVVERCDHPHVRLLADIYHMVRDNQPPDDIARYGHLLAHTHIAEKAQRTPPGVAGDDFRPYFNALNQAGYTGDMSIECGWGNLAAQAADAVKFLRQQIP